MISHPCELCFQYATGWCTGWKPSLLSHATRTEFCYLPKVIETLVIESANVCQLWNVLTAADIEKLRDALRPFIGMEIRKGEK